MSRASGGMFAFPEVSKLLGDQHRTAADLAAWLLDEAHVAVVPGEVFGADGRLRISFALDQTRLTEAADRLAAALTKAGS